MSHLREAEVCRWASYLRWIALTVSIKWLTAQHVKSWYKRKSRKEEFVKAENIILRSVECQDWLLRGKRFEDGYFTSASSGLFEWTNALVLLEVARRK